MESAKTWDLSARLTILESEDAELTLLKETIETQGKEIELLKHSLKTQAEQIQGIWLKLVVLSSVSNQ